PSNPRVRATDPRVRRLLRDPHVVGLTLDTIQRMTFEHFPPYAPELDPQEYVWRHLKHVDLRNLTTHDLDELWVHVRAVTRRLRQRAGFFGTSFSTLAFCNFCVPGSIIRENGMCLANSFARPDRGRDRGSLSVLSAAAS